MYISIYIHIYIYILRYFFFFTRSLSKTRTDEGGKGKKNSISVNSCRRGPTAQYWEGQMVMLHFMVTGFYSSGSQPAASTAGFTPGQRCRMDVRECFISVAFVLLFFHQNICKQSVSRSLRHTLWKCIAAILGKKKSQYNVIL